MGEVVEGAGEEAAAALADVGVTAQEVVGPLVLVAKALLLVPAVAMLDQETRVWVIPDLS